MLFDYCILLSLHLEEPEAAGVDDEMPIIDTVAGDVSMDDIQVIFYYLIETKNKVESSNLHLKKKTIVKICKSYSYLNFYDTHKKLKNLPKKKFYACDVIENFGLE